MNVNGCKLSLLAAKGLSYEAPDAVAPDGSLQNLFWYGNTDSASAITGIN